MKMVMSSDKDRRQYSVASCGADPKQLIQNAYCTFSKSD